MRALDRVLGTAVCVLTLGVSLAQAQQSSQGQSSQGQPSQGSSTQGQSTQGQTSQGQPSQGQQQTPDQSAEPIPAYRSPLASAADNGSGDVESQQGTPDDRSLSGAQNLSALMLPTRSYWQPQVNMFATVDSNPSGVGSSTDWTAGAVVSGRVDVHRISGTSSMDLSYMGGGSFSSNGDYGTGIVQALGFSDKISFHRSTLSFFDQFAYLPGSGFGYGGLGGLAGASLPGSGSTGLGPVFGPGGTILTGTGQSVANSSVIQFDTKLTRRSSLTLVGGYYLLHYFTTGLLNSYNPNFRIGYNYQLTHKDTIAGIYTYSSYTYTGSPQSFHTSTAWASYGRVVTQKVTFQIAGGPQWVNSQVPLSVSGPTTTYTPATQLYWSMHASVGLLVGRSHLGVSYYRGADAGSGVLAGSLGNTVTGSFTRAVSRTFSSGISGGYSWNQGVITNSTGALVNQTYDDWYTSATLSHPMGGALGLTLSYWFTHQTASTAACVGPLCGTSYVTNLISFGLGWHTRPMAF